MKIIVMDRRDLKSPTNEKKVLFFILTPSGYTIFFKKTDGKQMVQIHRAAVRSRLFGSTNCAAIQITKFPMKNISIVLMNNLLLGMCADSIPKKVTPSIDNPAM